MLETGAGFRLESWRQGLDLDWGAGSRGWISAVELETGTGFRLESWGLQGLDFGLVGVRKRW